jgi:hypothetical protein
MYIFLDESGDLGFDFEKKNTSQKFVICLVVCSDEGIIRKIKGAVRKTIKNKLKKSADEVYELKGSKTSIEVKNYFLKKMPENGWNLYCLALNKKRVYDRLTTKEARNKLYNFLTSVILQKLEIQVGTNSVTIVVDRSKSKEGIHDFNNYIKNQFDPLIPCKTPLYISHESSQENPCLQAVDLFSWGFFRKYERKDSIWYSEFSNYIVFEDEYLPKK